MKGKHYKRKPGEFEIRILKDGRVILVSPDEKLMDAIEDVDPNNEVLRMRREGGNDAGDK